MRMIRTWNDNIANVIRTVLFPDAEQKALMMIPEDRVGSIQAFVDSYMVNDPMGEALITDEKTRVLYYATESSDYGKQMKIKYLEFDIYVKRTERYTASNDGLRGRDKMIAQKIQELLTDKRYVCNTQFTYVDDYELGTKTTGFIRHHLVLSYKVSF